MGLTVLICTHNRVQLLTQVLASLNAAARPAIPVEILVVANNCSDNTHEFLDEYTRASGDALPLRWIAEPTPGKSHALNRAIPELTTELIAFVDDDHRIDQQYLRHIETAAATYPKAAIYCGRILPDWTGAEPQWVHDDGPYRIYPLPVPRYDQGSQPRLVTEDEGPIPGGGNLIVRRHVFGLAGRFSTELGPHGHDLGGGEDSDYVIRALRRGATLQYIPDIVQYHYVDLARLTLSYIVRKGFQRTRSGARIGHAGHDVPLYMWRKLLNYSWHSVFTLSWAKRRFYLVRSAAALGELQGMRDAARLPRLRLPRPLMGRVATAAVGVTLMASILASLAIPDFPWRIVGVALSVAGLVTATLVLKSLLDFSQTGPGIQRSMLRDYRVQVALTMLRLSFWAFTLMAIMALTGAAVYGAYTIQAGSSYSIVGAVMASCAGILLITGTRFARTLVENPGLLVASMHYRVSRLYPLWRGLNRPLLKVAETVSLALALVLVAGASATLVQRGDTAAAVALLAWSGFVLSLKTLTRRVSVPPTRAVSRPAGPPNIVLIGSDTLRADRLEPARGLAPHIEKLKACATEFAHCFVPCARTAPSLISILTGTWPLLHRVRDNFVADHDTRLPVPALPQLLAAAGYRTAAVSDWCGADMGKFDFGFDHLDLPTDQWNFKYLIRQGPKDLRLFLSLFVHNRLGERLLPEIFYLGGVPITSQIGIKARNLITGLAADPRPFLLNIFYSTTHPPFASEDPWYTRYAAENYAGESKFAMARLTDPFDIIRRQAEPREEFDLEQILHLYDGCVAQFDDEVGRLVDHLKQLGIADHTVIVVYSDHGMEFFEHGTWGQGNSAYGDYSSRIPLLICDPRNPAPRKVDATVRSIDIAPTLLELAGCAPCETVQGTSLAPLISGETQDLNLTAYIETGIWLTDLPGMPDNHLRYPGIIELLEIPDQASGTLAIKPAYRARLIAAKDRAVVRGRWKLLYQPLIDGFFLGLFDTASDPGCQHDLAATHPTVVNLLWHELTYFLALDGISIPSEDALAARTTGKPEEPSTSG
ncbi:MAG: sulfatase-like hydrolase/transferase [Gammaproteobacteria bacterium]|nr:sulfatase-like hydrolase/transferase [Gammaproteobacteria bacterium]